MFVKITEIYGMIKE